MIITPLPADWKPYFPDDRLYLSLWLYTFESFTDHPELLVQFIESTFDVADPFEQDLRLVVSLESPRQERQRRFSRDAWEWCKSKLAARRVAFLLTHKKDMAPPPVLVTYFYVGITPTYILRRSAYRDANGVMQFPSPNNLFFVIEFHDLQAKVADDLQQMMVKLARGWHERMKCVYGFINLDRRMPSADQGGTQFERRHEVFVDDTARFLQDKVRGAFWENYLNEGQVGVLGGPEEVKRNAPCARVEALGPGRGLILRLTDDVNDVTAERRRELEEYFAPLALTREEADARYGVVRQQPPG